MIGSELDKQIFKEGENTWGCKNGWLDVEDVKNFIKKILNKPKHTITYKKWIKQNAGKELL